MRRAQFSLIIALLLLLGCGTPRDETESFALEPVVAVVGGEQIYARDFRLNYELGFPHLRRGEHPRLVYLMRMIDEKLLAQEGYRLGLDQNRDVQQRINNLREEMLVEQVFVRYVNADVHVTEEDIRTVAQKDRVAFKLRYLPLPTLERAQAARVKADEVGFDEVVREFAAARSDIPVRPEDLESPYLNWRDVHPRLMAAIENLQVGKVSQPVRYNGTYLLIQVLDVRRNPMGPLTGSEERSRYEQIIFQQKARAKAREFVGTMMKPLDVRVKPSPYVTLRNNLWRWHQDAPPQENLLRALETTNASYGDSIRAVLDDVLITTNQSTWTVRQFLRAYPIKRYPLRYQRTEDFESDLYDAVGLTLRDSAFVARAKQEGLGEDPLVKHEMRLWSDKWVYRAMADRIEKEGASVEEMLTRLRDRSVVHIDRSVLDTLELSDPHSPGLFLFKGHTKHPVFPIVDATR